MYGISFDEYNTPHMINESFERMARVATDSKILGRPVRLLTDGWRCDRCDHGYDGWVEIDPEYGDLVDADPVEHSEACVTARESEWMADLR